MLSSFLLIHGKKAFLSNLNASDKSQSAQDNEEIVSDDYVYQVRKSLRRLKSEIISAKKDPKPLESLNESIEQVYRKGLGVGRQVNYPSKRPPQRSKTRTPEADMQDFFSEMSETNAISPPTGFSTPQLTGRAYKADHKTHKGNLCYPAGYEKKIRKNGSGDNGGGRKGNGVGDEIWWGEKDEATSWLRNQMTAMKTCYDGGIARSPTHRDYITSLKSDKSNKSTRTAPSNFTFMGMRDVDRTGFTPQASGVRSRLRGKELAGGSTPKYSLGLDTISLYHESFDFPQITLRDRDSGLEKETKTLRELMTTLSNRATDRKLNRSKSTKNATKRQRKKNHKSRTFGDHRRFSFMSASTDISSPNLFLYPHGRPVTTTPSLKQPRIMTSQRRNNSMKVSPKTERLLLQSKLLSQQICENPLRLDGGNMDEKEKAKKREHDIIYARRPPSPAVTPKLSQLERSYTPIRVAKRFGKEMRVKGGHGTFGVWKMENKDSESEIDGPMEEGKEVKEEEERPTFRVRLKSTEIITDNKEVKPETQTDVASGRSDIVTGHRDTEMSNEQSQTDQDSSGSDEESSILEAIPLDEERNMWAGISPETTPDTSRSIPMRRTMDTARMNLKQRTRTPRARGSRSPAPSHRGTQQVLYDEDEESSDSGSGHDGPASHSRQSGRSSIGSFNLPTIDETSGIPVKARPIKAHEGYEL
ncbi:hypothetical protein AAMO2058_000489300 [Amorphochlora amoebiformis]